MVVGGMENVSLGHRPLSSSCSCVCLLFTAGVVDARRSVHPPHPKIFDVFKGRNVVSTRLIPRKVVSSVYCGSSSWTYVYVSTSTVPRHLEFPHPSMISLSLITSPSHTHSTTIT